MAAPAAAPTPEGLYAQLAARLAEEPDVSLGTGRKGFGATALQCGGKMFALLSARGEFVVKLDAARVAALVAQGQGSPFTMGGRAMREWLVVAGESPARWDALAREALAHARALASR